jgi:protoheme IX farnesyltransferase
VLKPRETGLLTVIGACTAFIAIYPDIQIIKFIVAILAIGIGSAGCNGLTNYLDRTVDGRMERTRRRALPQHLIDPPQKVLPMVLSLIMISLIMAWYLNPWCFIIGVIGVAASSLWRKTITCTIFGIIAGCCPILIGWLSANPVITAEIILITVLVAIWIPIHIWSVMVSKQHEYRNAGLNYFPLNLHLKITVRIMFVLGSILVAVSMLLYAMAFFHVVYFAVALVLGIVLLVSLLYLMIKTSSSIAWLVYKFSSFPYLGIIFAAMVVDKVTG